MPSAGDVGWLSGAYSAALNFWCVRADAGRTCHCDCMPYDCCGAALAKDSMISDFMQLPAVVWLMP